MTGLFFCYIPMQLVAPRAVTIAVATDAMICTMNFSVSFFVMVLIFKFYHFYIVQREDQGDGALSYASSPLCLFSKVTS